MVRIAAAFLCLLGMGCGYMHYSVTPYGKVGSGKEWQAGVSVTFYDKRPGAPAVPVSYIDKSEIIINNGHKHKHKHH